MSVSKEHNNPGFCAFDASCPTIITIFPPVWASSVPASTVENRRHRLVGSSANCCRSWNHPIEHGSLSHPNIEKIAHVDCKCRFRVGRASPTSGHLFANLSCSHAAYPCCRDDPSIAPLNENVLSDVTPPRKIISLIRYELSTSQCFLNSSSNSLQHHQ